MNNPQPAMVPDEAENDFDSSLRCLLSKIEAWGADERARLQKEENRGVFGDRSASIKSALYFGFAQLLLYLIPRIPISIIWQFVMLVVAELALVMCLFLLVARVIGVGRSHFFRDLKAELSFFSEIPFGTLKKAVGRDLYYAPRFDDCSSTVIEVALRRMESDERRMREHLTVAVGNPSLGLLATFALGGWTTWKNFSASSGWIVSLLMAAWLGSFAFCAALVRVRYQLTELARARVLLEIVLARRTPAK